MQQLSSMQKLTFNCNQNKTLIFFLCSLPREDNTTITRAKGEGNGHFYHIIFAVSCFISSSKTLELLFKFTRVQSLLGKQALP